MRISIYFLICTMMLVPSLIISDTMIMSTVEELNDIDILILISEICGWNYFVVNRTFVGMGVNVITITNTESYTVTTCPNKEPRPITADLRVSDFNLETINEYDGIIIPSGRAWRNLWNDTDVHEFLQVAYDNGLVIGSVCNGGLVIGNASIVTNGTKIARPLPEVHQLLRDRGAIIMTRANAVSDRKIVTSDIGQGPPTGHESAPTYEVCFEMVKAILGQSYVANTEVTLDDDTTNFEYSITIEIADLSQEFPDFNISDVYEVKANIHPETNSTDITEIELSSIQGTDQYTGTFMVSNSGNYIIDLDIKNEELTYEIVRSALTFNAGDDSSFVTLILLSGGIGGVVVVILLLFWKRKT